MTGKASSQTDNSKINIIYAWLDLELCPTAVAASINLLRLELRRNRKLRVASRTAKEVMSEHPKEPKNHRADDQQGKLQYRLMKKAKNQPAGRNCGNDNGKGNSVVASKPFAICYRLLR